jgi:hypothetical protein
MAAVRKFSNAEAQANDAAQEFVESGGKSVWLADSEVQFARLKESDPTNPSQVEGLSSGDSTITR